MKDESTGRAGPTAAGTRPPGMPAVAGRAVFEAELALVLGRDCLASLLAPPRRPGRMHVVRHLRAGGRIFETYWATLRGVQAMDYSCDQHCKAGNND